MSEQHYTVKNKRGANIEIGEIRPDTYHDWGGCTVDIQVTVWSDDFKMKYSFWLMDYDTGWSGEDFMEGYYESELENNEDFTEDMELTDIYTEEELEEMVWDDIMSNYEFYVGDCPILDYVNRIEDALEAKADDQFEYGDVMDPDIDALLEIPAEAYWEDLDEEDLIDYDGMARNNEPFVRTEYGERYTSLIDDFKMEKVGEEPVKEGEQEQNENLDGPVTEYCEQHPANCLLLPYAICKGMLGTSFVQPEGLTGEVRRLLDGTDWTNAEAAEATLLATRTLVLTELKKSRWVDTENWHFRRYKYCDDAVYEAHSELESLCRLFKSLCPKSALDIKVKCPFELSVDKTANILRLRKECNVAFPRKLAYDFLLDAQMKESYSKQVFHQDLDYYHEEYDKTRLSFIRDEVFDLIYDKYFGGKTASGLVDAAMALKEYPGESFVAQLLEAESEDDFFNEDGHWITSHGICYYGSDSVSVQSTDDSYFGLIHIPSFITFNGRRHNVDSIDNDAFDGCEEVKRVIIDEGLTEISESAFKDCTGLREIALPASLRVLGSACFEGCTNLTSIFIPAGVTDIEAGCFEGCSALARILVDDANPVYKSIDGVLYDKQSGQRLFVPDANKAIDEDSPANQGEVVEEGDGAFSVDGIRYQLCDSCHYSESHNLIHTKDLQVLPLENGASYAGKVIIPARIKYHKRWREVTSIHWEAFKDCPDLLEVGIPASVTDMRLRVTGSPKLAAINVDEANKHFVSIDGVVYDKEKKMTEILCYPFGYGDFFEIPGTVKSIGYEFNNCTQLRSIVIPQSVTYMRLGAFEGCTGLQEVFIPGSIKSIERECFNGCSGLRTVTFGEGVESIGLAFCDCISLQKIVFPESLKSVNSYGFQKCGKVESIRFPKGKYFRIDAIPKHFYPWEQKPFIVDGIYYEPVFDYDATEAMVRVGCLPDDQLGKETHPGIETLSVPPFIEQHGFTYWVREFSSYCTQFPDLRRLELPETVKKIYILSPALKEIVVDSANPEFTTIDGLLYSKDLRKLLAVPHGSEPVTFNVREGVETIAKSVFADLTSLKEVVLPDSVKLIEEHAFENCPSLCKIHFGNGIEKIDTAAFLDDTALTSVSLPASIKEVGQKPFSGYKPFKGCTNLKEFVIAEGGPLTTIDGVIYQKTDRGLRLIYCPPGYTGKLVIPEGVVTIGKGSMCSDKLQSVVISDSVETIEGWAFYCCKGLKEIVLGKNVAIIERCAFSECPSLQELDFTVCEERYPHIDPSAFKNNPQLKLILPSRLEYKREDFEKEMNNE